MMVGAALEAQRPQRYAVGSALMCVQGPDRLLLEQFRRQARLEAGAAHGASGDNSRVVPASQTEALRQRVVIPLEELLREGAPRAVTPQPQPPRTFAPSNAAPVPPAAASGTESTDPFLDDPQTPPAASLSPPGVSPAPSGQPAADPPAAAANDDDPFSDF
jgi:hypothetical protein